MDIINKVILCGRISSDLELRFFQSGTAVLNFNLACDRGLSKEKKAEAQQNGRPTADFPRCKAIGKTAELIAKHFNKGDMILITDASIETGSYDGQNGKVYTTEVFVNKFEFVGGNKQGGHQEPMAGGGSDEFNFNGYNPDDFQAIEDDSSIPF